MIKDFKAERFRQVRVLVVGDVMLDKYVHGTVERISPEAPIPILRRQSTKNMPGGAANVAANIAALGARAGLIGMAAKDAEGLLLRTLLAEGMSPIDVSLLAEASRPTTVKTRFGAGSQQILRVDTEDARPVTANSELALLEEFARRLPDADVVVLSDYAKGLLTDRIITTIISMARELGLPVLVDPKRRNLSVYRGATMIKPNLSELQQATGIVCDIEERIEIAARIVLDTVATDMVLITSPGGMWLFRNDAPVQRVKVNAREVVDVSGAGDSAIAAFAVALSSGCDPFDAMEIANAAAGLSVLKLGAAIVTAYELAESIYDNARGAPLERVMTLADALTIVSGWRARGLSVGFTNGCFDILHAGHVSLLNRSARECDRLILGLNSDASINRLKGMARPVQDEGSRALVLASLEAIDLVVIFDEDTPIELITAFRPDILIKGADYQLEDVVGAEFVKSHGGRLVLIDLVKGYSTTNTLRRVVSPGE